MKIYTEDINGCTSLLKKEIVKHFDVKINDLKLSIINNMVYFDGSVLYMGISANVYGRCMISYKKPFFIIRFQESFLKNGVIQLDLVNFLNNFIKMGKDLFIRDKLLYVNPHHFGVDFDIKKFEIVNDMIELYFNVHGIHLNN